MIKRALVGVMFQIAAGLFVLLAFLFALLAGYQALIPEVGPVYAALIIAGGLLLVALIIRLSLAVYRWRQQRRSRAFAAMAAPMAVAAAPAMATTMTKLPVLIAVGVLATGYILARRS